jgi:hypothetical protein
MKTEEIEELDRLRRIDAQLNAWERGYNSGRRDGVQIALVIVAVVAVSIIGGWLMI